MSFIPNREFPSRPVVGVGAVVVEGDAVLIVQRGREPLKGQWSLPGGAVELGETLDAAIAREVREETGLDVEVGPIVEVLNRIRRDETGRVRFHYVLVDFVCRRVAGELSSGSDAAAAAWATASEIALYDVAPATVAVIRKALERLRSGPWIPYDAAADRND
jgi:ADP-ribose pyrophosphatase YjhB (NUDIX family)